MNQRTEVRHAGALWRVLADLPHSSSSRIAVSDSRSRLSFQALYSLARDLAGEFSGSGVGAGDLVYLAVPNSTAFLACTLALFALDTKLALASTHYREAEWNTLLEHLTPTHVVTTVQDAPRLSSVRADVLSWECREVASCQGVCLLTARTAHGSLNAGSTDLAHLRESLSIIKFSGGSTGIPKAIALSSENVFAEARHIIENLALTARDRILVPVPLFHSYGFDLGLLACLFSGAEMALCDPFVPRTVARLLQDQVTVFLGVPSMYSLLVESSFATRPQWSAVRYFLSCTAPLSQATLEEFNSKFGCFICQHYGSSETGAVATHVPGRIVDKKASVGRACEHVSVSVHDSQHAEVERGVEGEIVVTSDAVALGYLMGAPPGPSRFHRRSFHTGDSGVVDAEGFITLTGRADQIINVGGFKVSPIHVTLVLEGHPAVREAAVWGVKDKLGHEIVYAMVALRQSVSEQGLRDFCQKRLADYEVPRRIDVVDRIPRTASGKPLLRPLDSMT